jgi:hypothetical protein
MVDPGSYHLEPGQLVVVAGSDDEWVASVAIGSGQLVENEAGAAPVGRVVRLAEEADVRAFGQRMAEELGVVALARERCAAVGAEVVAAWLAPDGSRATITLAEGVSGADGLAREIAALLGIDVVLQALDDEGAALPINGVDGAGLPADWTDWLVLPGAGPVLQVRIEESGNLTAGGFIERLFPTAENWPPARSSRHPPAKDEPN